MKFLIDPIESHPPHAFALPEIKAFMRLLPEELKRDVKTVRLHNGNRHMAARRVAVFSRLEERLVIASRGLARDRVIQEIVCELVRRNLAESDAWRHQLSQSAIDARARAILAVVKPKMPPALRWNRTTLRYAKPRLD